MLKNGEMLPYRQAEIYFGDKFLEVLAWYFENGYVYSGDDVFVMACKHDSDALISEKDVDKEDCWYIQYASGNLKRLFEIIPEEKPWVIFERGHKKPKKRYAYDKFKRKLGV